MPSCRRLHQAAYAARVDEGIDPYGLYAKIPLESSFQRVFPYFLTICLPQQKGITSPALRRRVLPQMGQ